MTDRNPSPEALALYATDAAGATVELEARTKRNYRWRFKTMFHPTLHRLSEMDRPSVYHRCLWFALTQLDPIQWRALSAREVAEHTRMSLASAEKALAMLEADRVILTKGRTANKRRRINNSVAWAAKAHQHSEADADPEVIDARGRS